MDIQPRPNLVYLTIFPPSHNKQIKFAGYVKSVSCLDKQGPFDILPGHENLFTNISGKIAIVDEESKNVEFQVQNAVLEASQNVVKIFVNS